MLYGNSLILVMNPENRNIMIEVFEPMSNMCKDLNKKRITLMHLNNMNLKIHTI